RRIVHFVGKALELYPSLRVGAGFEIQLPYAGKTVGDVDLHIGGVDRLAVGVGHGEIERTRADSSVDDGAIVGLTRLGGLLGLRRDANRQKKRRNHMGKEFHRLLLKYPFTQKQEGPR